MSRHVTLFTVGGAAAAIFFCRCERCPGPRSIPIDKEFGPTKRGGQTETSFFLDGLDFWIDHGKSRPLAVIEEEEKERKQMDGNLGTSV